MKHVVTAVVALAGMWAASSAEAALIVEVGDHNLLADTSGQQVQVFVRASDGTVNVVGVDLAVQVADGVSGVRIVAIDMEQGTLFQHNNQGQDDQPANTPWIQFVGIMTQAGTIAVSTQPVVLATFTFDTTGVSDGVFDLTLSSILGRASDGTQFVDGIGESIETHVIDGTLTVVPVPEPSAMAATLGAVAAVAFRRRRPVGC